jgi:hypothetical protein
MSGSGSEPRLGAGPRLKSGHILIGRLFTDTEQHITLFYPVLSGLSCIRL